MKTYMPYASNPWNLKESADSHYPLPVSQLVDLSGAEDFYLFSGLQHNRVRRQLRGQLDPNKTKKYFVEGEESPSASRKGQAIAAGAVLLILVIILISKAMST